MREVVEPHAPQLLLRIAGNLGEAVVHVQPRAVAVDEGNAERRLIHRGAEAVARHGRRGLAEQRRKLQQGRKKGYHVRRRSVPARATSCRRSRRATKASSKPTWSTAATGMAISAPMMPKTVAPIMKATNAVSGEMATLRDSTRGAMKRFSSFWKTRAMINTPQNCQRECNRAMISAGDVPTIGPMTGTISP